MKPRKETLADGIEPLERRQKASMLPQDEVTIYALCDPASGEARYVGKTRYTTERRLTYHMSAARHSKTASARWLMTLKVNGFRPSVAELEKVDVNADWQSREIFWIAHFRQMGARLLNLTDGGEGQHGRKIEGTDHARKISDSLRRGLHFLCEECGEKFWRKPSAISKGDCRFCSRACYQASLRGLARPVPALCTERGVAAAAIARKSKTHCKRGHALSGDNVYINKRGARVCKECRRIHKLTYRAKGAA